ncbi:MAG: inorganic diphosphatase [Candidatus Marinimicrobia bacterium]|nr:inorganic diphosphatase [Candidatus Neomarinimicrobiota bacterium]
MTHNLFHLVSLGENSPKEVNCLVEVPKGSSNKIEYYHQEGYFHLDRVLYEAVFFPFEYGIIPQTWNDKDKDPLDIVLLSSFSTFSGCIIKCRPIGVIRIEDTGEQDDKIVAVPVDDPRFAQIEELKDLDPHTKKEIENFWENYSELQPDKKIKIKGWSEKKTARKLIKKAAAKYQKKFQK